MNIWNGEERGGCIVKENNWFRSSSNEKKYNSEGNNILIKIFFLCQLNCKNIYIYFHIVGFAGGNKSCVFKTQSCRGEYMYYRFYTSQSLILF